MEYNNLTVLTLNTSRDEKTNIKIELPKETNTFRVSCIAKVEYLGNNTYTIDCKSSSFDILMDTNLIKNSKNINQIYTEKVHEDKIEINIVIIIAIITLITLIITLIITQKTKIEKSYVRNPEEVIEPILAESIIDGKIGAKELIMSCIVDLIRRGNLKNIGDAKIQLIHKNKISVYENEILELLFNDINQIITFEDLKEIFIKNNKKSKKIFNRFNNIKNKIEEKFYNYNIYSKSMEILLKLLRVISIVAMIDSFYILSGIWRYFVIKSVIVFSILFCTLIAIGVAVIKVFVIKKRKVNVNGNNILILIFLPGIIVITSLVFFVIKYQISSHIMINISLSIIFIINMIIYEKTYIHILTKFGKYEKAKVQGLKDYILDYSLMKERKLESVIIWDEYLVYAVAFGIPNKITDKFNEELLNANITLQKIDIIFNLK